MTKWELICITLGGLVWLMVGFLALLDLIEISLIGQLFLLAPLVIAPLGLPLVKIPAQAGLQRQLSTFIRIGQPFCALFVTIAFLLPAGSFAGVLASSWLGLAGLAALLGLARFIARTSFDIKEIAIDAGLGYMAVGGGWLVLSRLDANPLGFDDTIVLLTAVHFHYAGFAALLITGLAGYALASASRKVQAIYQLSALGVITGTPLVAAGITLSPLLEVIGAIILATSLASLAYLIRFAALRVVSYPLARIFLTTSALCLLVGMVFTYLYAIGEFTGYHLVSIPQMVMVHGVVNSLGFALFGFLGWRCQKVNATD